MKQMKKLIHEPCLGQLPAFHGDILRRMQASFRKATAAAAAAEENSGPPGGDHPTGTLIKR